jgi:hypothetical protein
MTVSVRIVSTQGQPLPRSDFAELQNRPRLEAFFSRVDPLRGRLVVAIDATASRQPTWDLAAKLTGEMFNAVAAIGSLDVQLVYFRGWGECVASRWFSDGKSLTAAMSRIMCAAGHTQIRRVLEHTRKEHQREKVNALIFIGDACEEIPADLYEATCSVPIFAFQEGDDPAVTQIFATLAKLTGGASSKFDSGAAGRLRELLKAVAAFAVGGTKALANQNSESARLLLAQVGK